MADPKQNKLVKAASLVCEYGRTNQVQKEKTHARPLMAERLT
jgi:hypothetical protein